MSRGIISSIGRWTSPAAQAILFFVLMAIAGIVFIVVGCVNKNALDVVCGCIVALIGVVISTRGIRAFRRIPDKELRRSSRRPDVPVNNADDAGS